MQAAGLYAMYDMRLYVPLFCSVATISHALGQVHIRTRLLLHNKSTVSSRGRIFFCGTPRTSLMARLTLLAPP